MNIIELSKETWGVSNNVRIYLTKSASSLHSSGDSFFQFLGLLFVFVIVLVAAWFVSRFIGNKAAGIYGKKNISIVENYPIGSNKAIQIVRIADKYYALAIGKDNINLIDQIDEENIILSSGENNLSFKDMLTSAKDIIEKGKNLKGNIIKKDEDK